MTVWTTTGTYKRGGGRAHLFNSIHEEIFGRPMIGTFNILIKLDITKIKPSFEDLEKMFRYWTVRINGEYIGYAFRRAKTDQYRNVLEVITAEPLPSNLKTENLSIEIFENVGIDQKRFRKFDGMK